jgi:hypothetical protein
MKISAKESLGYFDRRSISHGSTKGAQNYSIKKQAKLQWLQDPN